MEGSAPGSTATRLWVSPDAALELTRPELMRAFDSRLALWEWRRVLVNEGVYRFGASNVDTWAMSRQVARIGRFVSHSWADAGWRKLLALTFHLHLRTTVVAATLVWLVFEVVAHVTGTAVLGWAEASLANGSVVERMLLPTSGIAMPFVFVAVAAAVMWAPNSMTGTTLFWDKCCINQNNPELMLASVQQLGAYLLRSHQLLILWSGTYCTRLWCMYEVAVFCKHRPFKDVVVAPLGAIPCVVALWVLHACATIGFVVLGPWTMISAWLAEGLVEHMPHWLPQIACSFCTCFATFFPVYGACSWYLYDTTVERIKARQLLEEKLANFSTADLQCYDEDDRLIVTSCIEQWFGSVEKFDQFIRGDLKQHFLASQGTTVALPYHYVQLGNISHAWLSIGVAWVNIHNPVYVGHVLCLGVMLTCVSDAVAMYLIGLIAHRFHDPHEQRSRRWAGIFLSTLCLTTCTCAALLVVEPVIPLHTVVPIVLVLSVWCAWLYGVRLLPKWCCSMAARWWRTAAALARPPRSGPRRGGL